MEKKIEVFTYIPTDIRNERQPINLTDDYDPRTFAERVAEDGEEEANRDE